MKKNVLIAGLLVGVTCIVAFVLLKTSSSEVVDDQTSFPALIKDETFPLTASEVKWKIDGKDQKMMAYNGSIPGPTLRVRQGSELTVPFTNNLNEPTTVHWHGLRIENAFDGVPDVTQAPVEPGETFEYKLRFPDPGVYWYHPHIREDKQQELGLYGVIVVEPEGEFYYPKHDAEEILVLDDVLLQEGKIAPFGKDQVNHALMGRFGNTMLVNGAVGKKLEMSTGEVTRLFLVNVANTRTWNLTIPGATLKRVGGDSGQYVADAFVEHLTLAPSERAIVDVIFEDFGTFPLRHDGPERDYELVTFAVSDSEKTTARIAFDTLRTETNESAGIEALRPFFEKEPDLEWRLDVEIESHIGMMGMGNDSMMGMMGHDTEDPVFGGIEWEDDIPMMNAQLTDKLVTWKIIDTKTGKENMDAMSQWQKGDLVKIRIFNDPETDHPMQHPIHLHGQRFLVVSEDGELNEDLVWKDTVTVRTGTTVDLLVEMSNPGEWMAHCHIAEHLHSGMMTAFTVEDSK